MTKRFAVMDLGTNTFHLLIAELTGSGLKKLVHRENAVKLGEGGINKDRIQPDAFGRGLNAMAEFKKVIDDYRVQDIRATATSALRNAGNGQEFIEKVKQQTAIGIEIITGEQEAAFIYEGIKAAGCIPAEKTLVLDIGGGSIEFIICDNTQIYWKRSFEIGAARLMEKFHRNDPIPQECINELNNYLEESLAHFFEAAQPYNILCLIGSSGAFESFAQLIESDRGKPFDLKTIACYSFSLNLLLPLLDKIITSSHEQREADKNIIEVRVDMIVVASLVTRFIIDKLKIKRVAMSTNSLKEGVLAEMTGSLNM